MSARVNPAARLEADEHRARSQCVTVRTVGGRSGYPAALGLDEIADHVVKVIREEDEIRAIPTLPIGTE